MVEEKYLVIKGCEGLGNRLFCVADAIEYCGKTNRVLCVDWSDGQFAAKGVDAFSTFFDLREVKYLGFPFQIPNFNDLSFHPPFWKTHFDAQFFDYYCFSICPPLYRIPSFLLINDKLKSLRKYWRLRLDSEPNDLKQVIGSSFKEVLKHLSKVFDKNSTLRGSDLGTKYSENVVIYADFRPDFTPKTLLDHVSLKPFIANIVDDFASKNRLSQNTIGIHIRMTDKQPVKKLEVIFQKIADIGLSDFQIFLATDNIEVENSFKSKYPHIITHPKFLPENTQDGLHFYAMNNQDDNLAYQIAKESIIDMFLLSKCEYLIYQDNSTFSQIAKAYHPDSNKQIDWTS